MVDLPAIFNAISGPRCLVVHLRVHLRAPLLSIYSPLGFVKLIAPEKPSRRRQAKTIHGWRYCCELGPSI